MNPEIKKQWVTALRSGEYKQGKSCMMYFEKNIPHYCCLGVLNDLAFKAGATKDDGIGLSFLTEEVVSWSGLKACSPSVNEVSLVFLNDKSIGTGEEIFRHIADLLEATPDDWNGLVQQNT